MFKTDRYYYIMFYGVIIEVQFVSYDILNNKFNFKTEVNSVSVNSDAYHQIFKSNGEEIIETITDLY